MPLSRSLISTIAAVLLSGLVLTSCADSAPAPVPSSSSDQVSDNEFLAMHDLAGLDAAQVVERLDQMSVADRPANLLASVRRDTLVLTDDQEREIQLPMPADSAYVSVAPFRDQTHDCYFHSLTTCVGELGDAEIHVTLTDTDGTVLIDDTRETFNNGFVGLWVPRGVEATVTIEHDGQAGTAAISTLTEDDPTCITTLRLA